jgi:hypothetical protein
MTWQKVASVVQSRLGRVLAQFALILSKTSGGIESCELPVSIIAGYEVSSPGFYIGSAP